MGFCQTCYMKMTSYPPMFNDSKKITQMVRLLGNAEHVVIIPRAKIRGTIASIRFETSTDAHFHVTSLTESHDVKCVYVQKIRKQESVELIRGTQKNAADSSRLQPANVASSHF